MRGQVPAPVENADDKRPVVDESKRRTGNIFGNVLGDFPEITFCLACETKLPHKLGGGEVCA